MLDDRGIFHNRDRAKQLIKFEGIKFGKITPTDIDFFIEYKDALRIVGDYKYGDAELPIGQRLLLQRLVNDFTKINKPSIAFVARHFIKDSNSDVDGVNCEIDETYFDGNWIKSNKKCTVKQLCEWFIGRYYG